MGSEMCIRDSRQPVQVLAESDGQVAVRGLSDGDQLIYPLPSALQDGSKVEVKSASSAATDDATQDAAASEVTVSGAAVKP